LKHSLTFEHETSPGTMNSDIVYLNVSGKVFCSTRQTLCRYPGSFIEYLFNGKNDLQLKLDRENRVFIDRSPRYFKKILQFLRDHVTFNWRSSIYMTAEEEFRQEIEYYGLTKAMFFTLRRVVEFVNHEETVQEDKDWLDPFVEARPEKFMIILENEEGEVVYQASGAITFEYESDGITSTKSESGSVHERPVVLSNGDLFTLSRKSWTGGCDWATCIQDGYGIIIHPPDVDMSSTFHEVCKKIRLMALPYHLSSVDKPRIFRNWTKSHEIIFSGKNSFSTYDDQTLPDGFIGKMSLIF